MKLHSKLHLTFIYAFIPPFYSIARLSKLRSIITSLVEIVSSTLGKYNNGNIINL